MLPDRVSNPGPLTCESGALPIALRGPAIVTVKKKNCDKSTQLCSLSCSHSMAKLATSDLFSDSSSHKKQTGTTKCQGLFTSIKQYVLHVPYIFGNKNGISLCQNNPNYLDPSYKKMDLEL